MNLSHDDVTQGLKDSIITLQGRGLSSGGVAAELLDAIAATPPSRCMWIEGDLHDPTARPCGGTCVTVVTVEGEERRSSWCPQHHLRVFVVAAEKVNGLRFHR